MKKLLILALTSAFVAAANAAGDWFTVAVSGSTQEPTGASWSTTPAAANVANSVISIDEDVDTALELTPIEGNTAPDQQTNTVVTVEATFTVVSDAGSLVSPGDEAKTALTVAKDGGNDYYYYWDGQWHQISRETATPTSDPVTVRIELDNTSMTGTTATIKVDDGTTVATVATVSTQTKTKVNGLAFAGTGKIGNINADYTKAYASYDGIYYATVGGAIAANGGKSDNITLYKHNGAFGEMPTDANDKVYYVKNASGTTADLGVFPSSGASPYTIGTLDEFKAFQQYVAAGFTTQGKTFTQTADIALDAAWPGIGVKAGKDLVNGSGKNISKYEDEAFNGTYDGGNHTISNFQMENGTDYGGLFNSINGATIKNLKVSYKEDKLCANSSSTGGDTGATFVGVARGSTLSNLTAKATKNVTTVSASKDMGGIVAYLMAGSTVDSCTNELNVASLLTGSARKSGGIALITQDGTGTATIRNCKNSGTVTLANAGGQAGGIVGYVGQSTTIENCENTAAVKMLTHMGNTVTLQGVNKGYATVASYTGNATPGLNFATVDGNVATFVADNDLAAGNTYKVMGPTATATYAFTATGFISFDTSLATPTFNITAGEGLVATPSTSDTVTTYTAAWQTFTVTWKNYDGTTLGTTTVDYNTTPTYDGETPTKAATAQYSYTFNGWTPTPGPVTADATYTATFTESVNNVTFTVAVPANTVVKVDGVEYTAGTQLSKPYGTEVTITYTPADGYVGEPKTQKITVAGDTETISAPSTYVAPVPAVAKIGTTYYATLAAAIGDAANNDTVTLLDNVTLAEALNLELGNKAVALDLDAKTLTGRTNLKSGSLTIKNGTVAGGSQQALNVYGSADSTAQSYSVLTIASDVNVTADVYGVCMFGATAGSNGYGAVVNIAGRVTTTGTGKEGAVFVSGNLGQNVSGDAHNVINVTGKITSATDAAIAMNGLAMVNVSDGAEVTGNTAIAVKRGTLNIQGGTVHATGEKNYPGTPNYNGTEMTGAAISVSDTYSNYGAMGANVTGGTIMSENADAIYKKDGDYKNDAPIAVSGGTFSSSVPVEFCADGFIPVQSGSTYGVEEGWKITWVVDGVKTVDTVKKGGNLSKPDDPTKSGYEFKGWTPAVVETPAADATYTAQWEQTATPVVSTAETTLVAVPADCTAAGLIDLSNRAAGDELKVYSKADKVYYTWTLTSGKAWEPAVTYKVSETDSTSHSKAASDVQLSAGQAAWLTRTDTSKDILLAVIASSETIEVVVEKGWNMIAPLPKGNESTVALNAVVSAGAAGDEIKIPTAGAPITCTYDSKTEKWGYWSFTKNDKGRITGKTWVSEVTIPAGTGLWYINGGSSKSVELK